MSAVSLDFWLELLSLLPLTWLSVILWRARGQFRSSRIFLVSLILIFTARLSDPFLEYSSSGVHETVGSSSEPHAALIHLIGDIADPTAILFLLIGFIQTIRLRRADEKKIRILESFWPICCHCRKYQTKEHVWMPLESLGIERRASRFTDGICPECLARMLKQAPVRRGREKKTF